MGVGTVISEAFYGATPGTLAYELYRSSRDTVALKNMNPDPLAQQQSELAAARPSVASIFLGICYERGCHRFQAGRAIATGVTLDLLSALPLGIVAYNDERAGMIAATAALTVAVRGGLHHLYRTIHNVQVNRMARLEDLFQQSGA